MNRRDFLRNTVAASLLFQAGETPKAVHAAMPRHRANILIADVVNSNGRCYPRETVESIMRQINDPECKGRLGRLGVTKDFERRDVLTCGFVVKNARMDGDVLSADVIPLDTEKGMEFAAVLSCVDLAFRPAGFGEWDDDRNVINYKLFEINAVMRNEDSFKGLLK